MNSKLKNATHMIINQNKSKFGIAQAATQIVNTQKEQQKMELEQLKEKQIDNFLTQELDLRLFMDKSKRLMHDDRIRKQRFKVYKKQKQNLKSMLDATYKDGLAVKQSILEEKHRNIRKRPTHIIKSTVINTPNTSLNRSKSRTKSMICYSPNNKLSSKEGLVNLQKISFQPKSLDTKNISVSRFKPSVLVKEPKQKSKISKDALSVEIKSDFKHIHNQRQKYFSDLIDQIGKRRKTFAKFAFKTFEKEDNFYMTDVINTFNMGEPFGTLQCVDLWPDKNIKSFLGSCQLLKDKYILSKISSIKSQKAMFLNESMKKSNQKLPQQLSLYLDDNLEKPHIASHMKTQMDEKTKSLLNFFHPPTKKQTLKIKSQTPYYESTFPKISQFTHKNSEEEDDNDEFKNDNKSRASRSSDAYKQFFESTVFKQTPLHQSHNLQDYYQLSAQDEMKRQQQKTITTTQSNKNQKNKQQSQSSSINQQSNALTYMIQDLQQLGNGNQKIDKELRVEIRELDKRIKNNREFANYYII